jgi:two-component system, response regulator / RNA-binding antiterminator
LGNIFCIAKEICALHHCSMPVPELIILVIDESLERAALIESGLRDAGHSQVVILTQFNGLVRRIEEISPDVVVMDLGNPNRDFLEHMLRLSKAIRKPVAMFVDQSSEQAMFDAVEAGVSAYVVDGLRRDRVKPILDLAIVRFRAFEKIRQQRDDAVLALDERKSVDRAKGIIMQIQNLNEDEAYALLRNAAMQQGRKIGQIAEAIILSANLIQRKL